MDIFKNFSFLKKGSKFVKLFVSFEIFNVVHSNARKNLFPEYNFMRSNLIYLMPSSNCLCFLLLSFLTRDEFFFNHFEYFEHFFFLATKKKLLSFSQYECNLHLSAYFQMECVRVGESSDVKWPRNKRHALNLIQTFYMYLSQL